MSDERPRIPSSSATTSGNSVTHPFYAVDALNKDVVRVGALARPGEMLRKNWNNVCAVFSDEDVPVFMGLVMPSDVARRHDRIFADLLPELLPAPLRPDVPLEDVERRFAQEDCAALPVVDDGGFIGVVTLESLLRTLLGRERIRARDEARGGLPAGGCAQALFEHPLIGVGVLQGDVFTCVNPRFAQLLGRAPGDVLGRLGLADITLPQDWLRVRSELAALKAGGEAALLDFRVSRHGEAGPLHLRSYASRMDAHDGRGVLLACLDMSREVDAGISLRLAAMTFDCAVEGIIITDGRARILAVNLAFTRISGYRVEDVLGHTPSLFKSGRQDEKFYRAMWDQLREQGGWEGGIWNRRKDGEVELEWLRITAVRRPDGEVTHYIGTFYDIARYKEAEKSIKHLSHYDSLTGLPNSHSLGTLFTRFGRQPGIDVAVLFIDIDRMKEVNDTFGRAVGDQLLQKVAQRLACGLRGQGETRERDFIGRFGGDEFLVVLWRDGNAAEAVARHIHEILSVPFSLGGCPALQLAVSIGIARCPQDGIDADDLVRKADLAMYEARQRGGRCTVLYRDHLDASVRQTAETRIAFRHALECGELMLVYQPQIEFATGCVVGLEALMRWRHPERGLLAPDVFGHLLDGSDYCALITRWALRTATVQGKAWHEVTGRPLRISVNLSPAQFYDSELKSELREALLLSGFPPACLELEITEASPLINATRAGSILQRLNAIGVRIALDNFGVGHSSLNHLRSLPIHTLKLDRSFVARLPEDEKDAAVAAAITALAHKLGLEVVAVGVETAAHSERLKALGSDMAQGFLYCRPMPPDLLEEAIRQPSLLVPRPGAAV